MNKVKYYPKIEVQFGQHHMSLLKEKVLQGASHCCHYGHSIFLCMRIGQDSTPTDSPYCMSRAYIKHFGKLVLTSFDYFFCSW